MAKNATVRYQRAQQLLDRKSISDEEFDQRSTDYEVANSMLATAQLDAQAVIAGIRHRLVLLRIARRKLELTQVKVPTPTRRERMSAEIKYAVVERKVTEGEMLKDAPGSSTATFELVMDGVLKLRAAVPERFAGQVQDGQKAEVRVDAYPDQVFPGEVMRINPLIDRTSRTFEVEVYVENPDRELKAGGFAKVDILTHVDPQAWTVPAEAIVTYAGSIKIFVVRGGNAHAVPVAPGLEGRGWVELVRSADSPDLRPDDQVITSGQEKLAEGVAVTVRERRPAETQRTAGVTPTAMSLWDLCIRRPVFTVMLVSAPIVLGLVGRSRLGVDLLPNVEMPIVVVTTTLKGASVEEMETSVTKPIEQIINTVSGIDELQVDDQGGHLAGGRAVLPGEEPRRGGPGGPRQGLDDPRPSCPWAPTRRSSTRST